jgi:hypothetical protein
MMTAGEFGNSVIRSAAAEDAEISKTNTQLVARTELHRAEQGSDTGSFQGACLSGLDRVFRKRNTY